MTRVDRSSHWERGTALRRAVLTTLTVLLIAARCTTTAGPDAAPEPSPLTAAGFIEAEEITLATEVGGRVVALNAQVGDEVEAGAVIARLDDRLAAAQVRLAEAQVREAEARLAMARNGATAPRIRIAEARLGQAEAGEAGACRAWEDAKAILASPQELDRQIQVTRAQVRAAEAGFAMAEALKDAAEIGLAQFDDARDLLAEVPDKVALFEGGLDDLPLDLPEPIGEYIDENDLPEGSYRFGKHELVVGDGQVTIYRHINANLPTQAHFVPNQYWQAWVGRNTAYAAYEGLQSVLGLLYTLRSDPAQLQAQVDEAGARCRQARAQTVAARSEVEALREGARPTEIAAMEAQVQQARGDLAQKELRLAKMTLRAPASGIVLERALEPAELAAPNAPIIVMGDLDVVYLTLYLPASALGEVALGQGVTVRLDSLPGQTFTGEVSAIGQEAEFPPQAVPQPDDRATLVFSVRVRLPNPDHKLKPGTYAEATFQEPHHP
jgi:multidrug resistance efflux pump